MRILFLASLFFAVWTQHAVAEMLRDQTVSALEDQNYEELEQLFTQAWDTSQKEGDNAPLRQTYFAVFERANKDRFETTKAWQSDHPDSPFAATALAKQHLVRAFLFRGTRASRYTSREAFDAYRRELSDAKRFIDIARDASPDFVPALDAAVALAMTGYHGDPHFLSNRLIDVAPDIASMQTAISGLRTQWGGTVRENILLCATMAHKVPEYDAELCLIEVAFANKVKGPLRDAAIAALAKRDEAFLDYIRIQVYIVEWRYEPNALEEIKRIHRATVDKFFDPDKFMNRTSTINAIFNTPFFAAEMNDAALQTMAKRLGYEPQNHFLANAYFKHSLHLSHKRSGDVTPELKKELTALWPNLLELGRFNPEVWETGRQIMAFRTGWHDVEALMPFARNRIYYSNHSPNTVRTHMDDLYGVWDVANGGSGSSLSAHELAAAKEAVECPLVRASRLYEAICAADPRAAGCNVGGWAGLYPEHARRIGRNSTQCAAVQDADIETLVFTPVDISPNIFSMDLTE